MRLWLANEAERGSGEQAAGGNPASSVRAAGGPQMRDGRAAEGNRRTKA